MVRTQQGAVRAFLRRLTRHAALADDLAQTAFMRAYEKRAQVTDKTAIRGWVFSIAYRVFLDHARKTKRRAELSEVAPKPTLSHDPPSGMAMDVAGAMAQLPEDCRAAVMLVLAYGFSQSEAAQALDMPLGTVKSHCTRGKVKLRGFLADYAPAESV